MENYDRILRPKEVAEMVGLSRNCLYKMIRRGSFPPFICLGPKARGQKLSRVIEWIEERELASGDFRANGKG